MPKVTVIVPNYNHAPFLERRIRSILDQTYEDFDLILLDDASTDGSDRILEGFSGDPRVQAVVRNQVNSGVPFKQWNRGVALAGGEYVWIAESDDYADPTFLAELVAILDRNPRVGIAYCKSQEVDEHGRSLSTPGEGTPFSRRWDENFVNGGTDECSRYLATCCTIPNASSALFRRSVYEAAGGAEEEMVLCGDWITWVRMLLISDIAYLARPLNFFRTHPKSVRGRVVRSGIYLEEAYQVIRHIRGSVQVPDEVLLQTCESMTSMWAQSLLSRERAVSWGRNRRIYQAGLKVDPGLRRRLARSLAYHALRRLVG